MRLIIPLAVAVFTVFLWVALWTATVHGQADACVASINGSAVDGHTIKVSKDADARVEATTSGGAVTNAVYLQLFGNKLQAASSEPVNGVWESTIPVKKYARWGVGRYRLVWESRDAQGDLVCKKTANIDVGGFPLGSVAGIIGAAALTVGVVGMALSLKGSMTFTAHQGGRWKVRIGLRANVERDKTKRGLRINVKRSITQTLLSTLGGTVLGFLLGGGTTSTLWQTATSAPTIQLALECMVPFTALGLLVGILRDLSLRRVRPSPGG